jgi:hypothetical protein
MISTFDSADQAIEKSINALCQKLNRIDPDSEEFKPIVEAISLLRASKNPVIHQFQK